MSAIDYGILAGLALAVVFIIISMARRKKRCKGGCAGCPYSGQCGK